MGPQGFQDYHQVYVRTAISVDPEGWAHFEYVKLPEYRWGIFLADPTPDRRIGFGDFFGQPVWQEVPGEFRNQLRRLIVTQGDTEPASVEQQRLLGQRCPSLYDLRNLFQVNVEEGRHLWAMVYLLHSYFGRDGRDEAEELLERQSGNRDKPRILEAFNEPIDNWLDFFMFTMFTDRDGKSQLMSLSESSLDPLSRTTRFMLTEEAHHMFVGETGIARILERTCQLMKQAGYSEDVRKIGGIDIPMIQKHLNQWFSLSLDLHGSEVSSNAASYFANGLKGRAKEDTFDEHVVKNAYYNMEFFEDGKATTKEVLMRNAMNEVLRDWYVGDCQAGVVRWNRILEQHGMSDRLRLPDRKFNRHIGMYSGFHFDPNGVPLTKEAFERRKHEWLPSPADSEYLLSIMAEPVYEPGKFANYIAPPRRGVNQLPLDFQYVRTEA
jgi:benzoyl-CoA 2,3-dioxygenase component B